MVEKINSASLFSIIFNAFIACFFGIGTYLMFNETQNDTIWIFVVCSLLAIPLYKMFMYIFKNNDKDNIYNLNMSIFPKGIALILNIVLIVTYSLIFLTIFNNLADFFNTDYLIEVPINYIRVLVLFPLIYVGSKSINTILKLNFIFTIIMVLLATFSTCGIIRMIDIRNIEPLLISPPSNIIKSVLTFFSIAIISLSMILIVSKKSIGDEQNIDKTSMVISIIAIILQFVVIFLCICVLSMEYINIFRLIEYMLLKNFELFNLLERIEAVLALGFYFSSFGTLSVLIHFIIKLIPKSDKVKIYPVFVLIVMYIISIFLFKNTIIFSQFIKKYFIYFGLIGILLPNLLTFFRLKKLTKSAKIVENSK